MTDLPPPSLLPALEQALAAADLPLPPAQTQQLAAFLSGLLAANRRLNLTRIVDPEEAIARHLLEPLAAWRLIQAASRPGPLFDVGSGGGVPGLPLAIADPSRPVVLIESRRRKADYLQYAVTRLGLPNVAVWPQRAEAVARSPARESAAMALARALVPLPEALELLLPLVQVGGAAAVLSGPSARALDADAALIARDLGGDPPQFLPVHWSGCPSTTVLVVVRKRAPTPARYPRAPQARRRAPSSVKRQAPPPTARPRAQETPLLD